LKASFKRLLFFLVRAPGRVNLIGEHTDYNEGFVLPMAINRAVYIALHPRPDNHVVIHSLEYNATVEFNLEQIQHGVPSWIEYIKGVAWAMQEDGWNLTGREGAMTGDIPRGAGLSSSAAVEIAAGRAFAAAADFEPAPAKLAELGRKAENHWVGVRCAIMDQMASSVSRRGHALFPDCRSLACDQIPLPPGVSIAILDTATQRG
jgi:galactokinase